MNLKETFYNIAPLRLCEIKSRIGEHCPMPPLHMVKITGQKEIIYLCDKCYKNICAGTYGIISLIYVCKLKENI